MPATDTTSRLTPYIEELLDNEHARENLREGASQLRAAYERSKKRRVKAAMTVTSRKGGAGADSCGFWGSASSASAWRWPPTRISAPRSSD